MLTPLALAAVIAAPAQAQDPVPLSPELQAMLDAAMASGNEGEVNTIVKYAKQLRLVSAEQLAKIADDWKAARAEAATRRLREAEFFELVKGRAQIGGFATTGNSQNIGVTGTLDLTREGLAWRHKLRLQADYQESFNVTTREHYLAAYEPNYKVNDRLYVYGAAQYESDRFFGYNHRISNSVGAGYTAVRSGDLTLNLELGPAFRYTDFTDDSVERNFAARGSVDLDWRLSSAVSINHDTSAYLQSANSTVASTSALNAKLFGPFSAQLSYAIQFESMPPVGRQTLDTTTRAALVVDF
nr:DUF481 domain-containing protein [Sphingomonas japonica]